jgi:hypothetical protein
MLDELSFRQARIQTNDVLKAYKDVSGWDGTEETDSGCYLLDMMRHFRTVGIGEVRCEAFVAVNHMHRPSLQAAIELFGGVILGLRLPKEAQSQDVWHHSTGMVPGSWGGHAVAVVAHSPGVLVCNTWGERKPLTWDFVTATCDEAYAFLIEDAPAPCGLDIERLRFDLARLM